MSVYFNDPREMAIRPESGVTLEEDNRYEEMWHWGAAVIDLCNLPIEEYMNNPFVNGGGNNSGDNTDSGETVTEETIQIVNSLVAPENEGEPYSIKFAWVGSFSTPFLAGAKMMVNGEEKVISQTISDNDEKMVIIPIEESIDATDVTVSSFLIADPSAADLVEEGKQTISLFNKATSTKYTMKLTSNESALYVTLSYKIDNELKYSITDLKFGDTIPAYSGSTDKTGCIFLGWKDSDGNEYTTMPAKNLILHAQYEVLAEPKAYYTIASNSSLEVEENLGALISIAEMVGMSFDCDDDLEEYFVVPADAIPTNSDFDAEAYSEDDGDNEYAEAWNAEHGYSFVLFVPSTYSVYSMKHGSNSTTNFVGTDAEKMVGTTEKDGVTYNVYAYCNGFHEVMQEETFDFKAYVILNKN